MYTFSEGLRVVYIYLGEFEKRIFVYFQRGFESSIFLREFENSIFVYFQRGFESSMLESVFTQAVLGNSIVAILAGLVAQQFADSFGFV